MTYGPIDFIALEFKGNNLKGEILHELLESVNSGVIRIIDLVVVQKDKDGQITVRELQELDSAVIAMFDPLQVKVTSMITHTDIDDLASVLENETTAGLMLIENLWAVKIKQAMLNANGRLVAFERIPDGEVVAALADIAVLASATV